MKGQLRTDIINNCSDDFQDELNDFIDEIENSVGEIVEKLSVGNASDIDDIYSVYGLAKDLHDRLY